MTIEGQKTILLVEDEALLAMAEQKALERYGYTMQTVSTGEKAMEFVQSSPGIDLILMDINLGEVIDGTEAAEIILKGHDVPLSSYRVTASVKSWKKQKTSPLMDMS